MKHRLLVLVVLLLVTVSLSNVSFASGWLKNEEQVMVWSSSESIDGEYFKWNGSVVNGYAEGKGILELCKNGILIGRYEGMMIKGKRNGKGIFTWTDGSHYEGDFIDNTRTGKGNMLYADGNKYNGDFVDGYRVGMGTYTWTDGDTYSGQWKNDLRSGKGVYTWKNGKKFNGNYENGKPNGYGTLYNSNGSIDKEGYWKDGKFRDPTFVALEDTEYVFENLFANPQEFANKHLQYTKSNSQFDLWVGGYGNFTEIQLGLNNGKIKYAVIKVNDFNAYDTARPFVINYYGNPTEEGTSSWGDYRSKWMRDDVFVELSAAYVRKSSYYSGSSDKSFMMFVVRPR